MFKKFKEIASAWIEASNPTPESQVLAEKRIAFKRQVELPVNYKGLHLDINYRIDLLVDGCLILELKSVDRLLPVHEAQLLTYMKLAKLDTGLLINFNVPVLKNGLKRMKL